MTASAYQKFAWSRWSTITKLSDYVVLDLETTGLSAKTEQIIEIGMIRVVAGAEVDRFSALVDPQKPISPHITRLTGITNADVQGAPLFADLAAQVAAFIGDLPVVGHNVVFDLSFLVPALDRCGIHTSFTYLDTLLLARKAFPTLPDHKLDTLITTLGLGKAQTHRALDDVYCTHALFQQICQRYSDAPLMDAISSCYAPIENVRISPVKQPLAGKTVALVGTFTFPYASAHRLIQAAGGTVSKNVTEDTDYLVYGYHDSLSEDGGRYAGELALASALQTRGRAIQIVNEVGLLALCGADFY